jgi:hypothetical protein
MLLKLCSSTQHENPVEIENLPEIYPIYLLINFVRNVKNCWLHNIGTSAVWPSIIRQFGVPSQACLHNLPLGYLRRQTSQEEMERIYSLLLYLSNAIVETLQVLNLLHRG